MILFSYIFSLLALFIAFKLHDKFDPARYFLILWGGQIVIIYGIFSQSFIFPGYGLSLIALLCITFSLGSFVGQIAGIPIKVSYASFEFKQKRSLNLLKFCTLIAIAYFLLGVYENGFNLLQIFSVKILLELNNIAYVNHDAGEKSGNILTQLALMFVYLAPLYGGYLLPLVKGKGKIWCYLSIVPTILITITQSIKSVLITSIALWVIGVLVSSLANNQSFFRIKFIHVFKIGLITLVFFLVLFMSMVLRTGKFNAETTQQITEKFVTYAFGHLPAFDMWFSGQVGKINPEGGIKTFFGISNFLGIAERQQGVFTDHTYFKIANENDILPDVYTNVFTVFRFVVEDFGFLGSIIFFLLTGMLSGYVLTMIRKQNSNWFYQVILIAILFFISWSFVASVWAYTSYILMIFLLFLLLSVSFTKVNIKSSNVVYSN